MQRQISEFILQDELINHSYVLLCFILIDVWQLKLSPRFYFPIFYDNYFLCFLGFIWAKLSPGSEDLLISPCLTFSPSLLIKGSEWTVSNIQLKKSEVQEASEIMNHTELNPQQSQRSSPVLPVLPFLLLLDFTTVISSSFPPPWVEATGASLCFSVMKRSQRPSLSCFLRLIELENEGRARALWTSAGELQSQ